VLAGRLQHCTGARNVIVFLGGLSFGVYLIHPMIIWEFENDGYGRNFINPWMAIPSLMIGVALISGLITYIIKKTPILRAIVPG
jgi:peptidoglycan/LPS O-acetylase OafA/YrhL